METCTPQPYVFRETGSSKYLATLSDDLIVWASA